MDKGNLNKKIVGIEDNSLIYQAIKKKFILVVFLVTSTVVAMGIFGGFALQKIWNASNDFAKYDVPAMSNLYDLEEVSTRVSVSINRLIPINERDRKSIDADIKSINENNDKAKRLFSNLELVINNTAEVDLLKKAEERFSVFQEKINEVNNNTVNGKIYDHSTEVHLLSMKSLILQTQEELFNLSDLIEKRISHNAQILSDTHYFVKSNIVLLAMAGLFVSAMLGLFIGKKSVLDPVALTEHHVEDLGKLNEELNLSNKLLKQRESSLSDLNEKLRQQDTVRSEFVSTVAHQLRTPLAGIKWTIDMLVNGDIGKLNVDQNTMLFKIADSNDRMIRFVNDLLSLSRMESGRLEYNFAIINLQHVVESVLLDLYPVANRKQITINFRGKGLTLPDVLADKDKIRVVFQNLLENAVKYSPQGGHVTIELRNKGVEVFASVIDEGIGIPKNEQKNIFNRFYRAPSAVKVESDGSGLGLFLAKNIVEGHNGKIWFESESGKGTSFYFTIPVPKTSTV